MDRNWLKWYMNTIFYIIQFEPDPIYHDFLYLISLKEVLLCNTKDSLGVSCDRVSRENAFIISFRIDISSGDWLVGPLGNIPGVTDGCHHKNSIESRPHFGIKKIILIKI